MSSGKVDVWKRIFDLWASIAKMVQNGKRSPEWLASRLQAMVDESRGNFELHLHPAQERGGGSGLMLDEYYKDPKFRGRHYYLEHPVVQGWLKDPETYPEEFKGKTVCLWGSRQGFGDDRKVACLIWLGNRVSDLWYCRLGHNFDQSNPALLASKQSKARLEQEIP
ncbi:MAG: hypothetical protein QY304_02390 [Candidatus Paceibacterota bacterium]|nr:MAG: hypothetical protein QY304_02390 [Candidatus Paceibacterota bacterium]